MTKHHKLLLICENAEALFNDIEQQSPGKFEIISTTSFEEALKFLKIKDFDCIVASYSLPDKDGLSVCKYLKSDSRLKNFPLIILSSKLDSDFHIEMVHAGADCVASPKEDFRILLTKINTMIRLKSAESEVSRLRNATATQKIISTFNHEFNNPLAIAVGNLHYLRSSLTTENQISRAEKIKEALDRMTIIIRKIRDLKDHVEDDYIKSQMSEI